MPEIKKGQTITKEEFLKMTKGNYTVTGNSSVSTKNTNDNTPKKTFGEKALNTLQTIFPSKAIGDVIGTYIAKEDAGENAKYVAPVSHTAGQFAGEVLQNAANLIPGAGEGANLFSKAVIGAGTGYLADVGSKLQKEGTPDASVAIPGIGTAIGGGLPILGAVARFAGKGVSELSGSLTGQGRGGQKALSDALQAGGDRAKVARAAMRGGYTGEMIKQEADQALGSLVAKRTEDYQQRLASISDDTKSYDISPIVNKVKEGLDSFGVAITNDGGLDFSRSPLRFNRKAQGDIQTIYDEMKNFGTQQGDRTAVGLDSLKRGFQDLYTESGEARKFVTSVSSEVRNVLKQVPGYDEMAANYSKSTDLIKDIQKNLGLGTRAGEDTAYKKFSQILRNDNDARSQLFKELDDASGGKLIPMVAGELSRPVLARGLTRPISQLLAGGAGISSGSIGAALKAMMIGGAVTSPRLAGEVINILGLSKKYEPAIKSALSKLLIQTGANSNKEE